MNPDSVPAGHYEDLLKKANLAIDRLQAETARLKKDRSEGIAVTGMSCRFPGGANDLESFWNILREGVDTVSEIPADRWDWKAFYDPELKDPRAISTKWGAFLDAVDQFDPEFFQLSWQEASSMDPQQRLLLEVSWEALENACCSPSDLAGSRTGVYVGISSQDYYATLAEVPARGGTGVALSIAANRLSYFYDLRGPSMVVDTACSSSLVAVDLACRALRAGVIDLAIVGGVNVSLCPETVIAMSQAGMMAADGRCKTFDEAADGFVRGEGCGVVILKRLADATTDRDHVYAVIKGSAVNQDGRSNGLTAPNPAAQQEVIQDALQTADVLPRDIGYVETHGSGTPLGDPIEFQSLAEVLREGRNAEAKCLVGSVKTNMGHLEAAAGMVGLMKTILCLDREEIVPHLHLKQFNPLLEEARQVLDVPLGLVPWPRSREPRFAGVSSFGFGGANSHVVLKEAPPPKSKENPAGPAPSLLCLSARSEKALRELAGHYADHLRTNPGLCLGDLTWSANTGRSDFTWRLAIVATNPDSLAADLADFAAGDCPANLHSGEVKLASERQTTDRLNEKVTDHERLAEQYIEGGEIDWESFYREPTHRRIPLPTYPFQRQRCWLDPSAYRDFRPQQSSEAK